MYFIGAMRGTYYLKYRSITIYNSITNKEIKKKIVNLELNSIKK